MNRKYWIAIALATATLFAMPTSAQSKKDLWSQGRVEVVFGGGTAGEPCYDCDVRRGPRPSPFPDERMEPYGYPQGDYGRDGDRWRDRAEAQREWEKDRREAAREWDKNRREAYREDVKRRQEWEREQTKAEREYWREEQKSRQEWERERGKDEREARREWNKERREFRRN